MPTGRPPLLPLLETHQQIVELLMAAFRGRGRQFGNYWSIFESGSPEDVATLCHYLSEHGHSVFYGQCDSREPHSYVSRIVVGRRHEKFPKARQGSRQVFLARYVAVGTYISAKTWERAESRQEGSESKRGLFPGQNR